jgi:hypothetical protein
MDFGLAVPGLSFFRGHAMSDTQPVAKRSAVPSQSGTLELVTRAARDGAADAREAAIRTWAATSRFVSRFVYTTCYTVSYGVVFPTVLLAQAIPRNNAAVRGLVDGAHAAILKVDQLHGTALEPPAATATPALAPA